MQAGKAGFTLIEMSIVLVVIGLVVGGVLVGQDLIRAAYVRAQISQIESFRTGVNTFYGKYQALPGDMNASTAASFGFAVRGTDPGQGDGNGIIENNWNPTTAKGNGPMLGGEMGMFWVDLTSANGLNINLIQGSFSTASITSDMYLSLFGCGDMPGISLFLPPAKIGRGNYISVWSGGPVRANDYNQPSNGINYFDITAGDWDGLGCIGGYQYNSIPVAEAYSIDSKIDDGRPQSGRVLAIGGGQSYNWVGDFEVAPNELLPVTPGDGIATPGTPATCYDNDGGPGATEHYSVEQNHGAGGNCSLSFQF